MFNRGVHSLRINAKSFVCSLIFRDFPIISTPPSLVDVRYLPRPEIISLFKLKPHHVSGLGYRMNYYFYRIKDYIFIVTSILYVSHYRDYTLCNASQQKRRGKIKLFGNFRNKLAKLSGIFAY